VVPVLYKDLAFCHNFFSFILHFSYYYTLPLFLAYTLQRSFSTFIFYFAVIFIFLYRLSFTIVAKMPYSFYTFIYNTSYTDSLMPYLRRKLYKALQISLPEYYYDYYRKKFSLTDRVYTSLF